MQDCFTQQVLVLANPIIILNEANNQKEYFQQMIPDLASILMYVMEDLNILLVRL